MDCIFLVETAPSDYKPDTFMIEKRWRSIDIARTKLDSAKFEAEKVSQFSKRQEWVCELVLGHWRWFLEYQAQSGNWYCLRVSQIPVT